jgi:RHS repeat-associated protein
MRHKNKPTALIMILALLVNLVSGGMPGPGSLYAYDATRGDQGHEGTKGGGGAENTTPAKNPCPPKKSPVNIQTGDYSYSHQDLYIPGRGMGLQVVRSYNSHDSYDGPFGYGWEFNLENKLSSFVQASVETVSIRGGDGVRIEFTRNPDGSYTAPLGRLEQLVKNADGGYTWTLSPCSGGCNAPRYQFNSSGYLTSTQDPNGNQMKFSYDSAGKLKEVTDATGRKLVISYGSNNKIAAVKDPGDRTFTYAYDAGGNLTAYTDPAGNTTTYTYNNSHKLTGIIDARGNTVTTVTYNDQDRVTGYSQYGAMHTYTYDTANKTTYKYVPNSWNPWTYTYNATGQVLTQRDPLYNTVTNVYNDKIYITSFTDARWFTTAFEYDTQGNRTGITDALGNKTTLAYHPTMKEVTSITDALGNTTVFEYDDRGNLVKTVDALGNATVNTYNEYGQLTKVTDALGRSISYTYDAYGYLSSSTDQLGNATVYVNDILGHLIQSTDANGNTRKYTYDIIGNMISSVDVNNNTTAFTYDTNYNLSNINDATGNNTSYEYDAYYRLIKETDALGNTYIQTYDAMGNLTSETDGNGNTITYTHDELNRFTKATYANSTSVIYAYDGNGNLLSLQDAKGNKSSYTYDALNRLTQVTYPNGSTETLSYDNGGHLASRTDPKGNTFAFTYDVLGRLTAKTYPDSTKATFSYDALSRMTAAANPSSQIQYTYDELWRVAKIKQDGRSVSFAYDKVGNRTQLVYPDGSSIGYSYDALNRLDKMKDFGGSFFAWFTHDKLSRRTKLKLGNGTETTYEYDAVSNLLKLDHTTTSSGQVFSSFNYGFDKTQNITSMTTKTGTHSYTYDKANQLTQVDYPDANDTTFSLDANGNWISVVSGETNTYTVNNLDQYTDVNGKVFTYDANGNLISDGINTYSYDYDNLLVQVVTPGITITYAYDPLGKKISRAAGTVTTKYVYDGDQVIQEVNKSGGLLAKYIYGPGMDRALKMERGSGSYFYHHEGVGSVTMVTNSSGAPVESYSYEVYGKPTIRNKSGKVIASTGIDNPYLFAGRDYDKDAGLFYYRARWYNPTMGRFLTRDPVGLAGGDQNLYRYVWNNPVLYVDPYGEVGWVGAAVGGAIGVVTGGRAGGIRGAIMGGLIGAAGGFIGQFGASSYVAAIAGGAAIGGGSDLAWQTLVENKSINCVSWWEVAGATALGGLTGGIGQRIQKYIRRVNSKRPTVKSRPLQLEPMELTPELKKDLAESYASLADGMIKGKVGEVDYVVKLLASFPEGRQMIHHMSKMGQSIVKTATTQAELNAYKSLDRMLTYFGSPTPALR